MDSLPDIVHILYSGVGGEAGVVFPLARAAAGQSRQHLIFYGIEPAAEANIRQCESSGLAWHAVQKRPGSDRRARREITRLLLEIRPSAVIVHTLGTLPACLSARRLMPGLAIIAVEHHSNALKSAKRWLMSLAALWRADRIVYLTESYRRQVASKLRILFQLRKKRTTVIANSLDLSLYQAPSETTTDRFTVGMQGRMVEGKDFPTLIRALVAANKNNPRPIHLELIGDGPRRAELEELARSLNVYHQITFTGMLSQAGLIAKMKRWHAYAHASLGETMSIAIMEAKACGLPIVATEAPGVSEFFRHRHNGILVPQGNAEQLGLALRELQEEPEFSRLIGGNAFREAESQFASGAAWAAYARLIPSPPVPSQVALIASHQMPI